ncbi:MAG: alpha/beta hydrolase, partial [Cellvibrionaceae bacterium]|nr:alpha/beta hydrolase [Cellvibrionaceae bacterium]
MESQDQKTVLEYLDKFANVFNTMVHEVLNHKLGESNLGASPMPSFDADKISQLLDSGIQVDTAKLLQDQMEFMGKQTLLWQNATKAFFGQGESVDAVVEEAKGDARFKDPGWDENPVFNYFKQAYLLNSQLLQNMVESFHFSDPKAEQQLKFYTRQYVNSVSPSNYVFTNPEVCREIVETKGQNLAKGLENFLHDLEQSPSEALKITQTDENAFELGANLATTPGQVVFQNDIIQLLHYTPTSKTVYKAPILISPPFINKFYILDLDQKKSMVRWLLEQGHGVFIISWVNPDASFAKKDFADYMHEGILEALDTVCAITGADKVNMVGWCVGGTLLATAASYLRTKGDQRINSLTFLTTPLDFSEPGEVGNFINEQSVNMIERNTETKGVFDGRIMATTFSMLRENSLFWSYFVNNYLKGKDPIPFDILYWNSDSTNIPAACYIQYLENTYVHNRLKQPGGLVIDGINIDMSRIDVPCFVQSSIADHIVLWQAAYKSAQLLGGPVRFVLAGS